MIGSRVEVINPGWIYSTYRDMAKLLKATNWKYNFGNSKEIEKGYTATVCNYSEYHRIALVEDHISGFQYLIKKDGIKVIESDFFEDEWTKLLEDVG